MNLLCIQHVRFEGPGSIGRWARARGHRVSRVRPAEGQGFPAPSALDWVVVLGGPMGAGDEAQHPWLRAEKRFLAAAVAAGRGALGICLGAQLLAETLGARVWRNPQPEIGWFPVTWTRAARGAPPFEGFPAESDVLHWHGDTFDLPRDAIHLAQSEACANQAFLYGERVIGLQFHLETTRAGAQRLVEHCGHELVEAPFVQPGPQIVAGTERFDRTHALLWRLLDRLPSARDAAPEPAREPRGPGARRG